MKILLFFITLLLSFVATAIVRAVMRRYHIVDRPKGEKRKIHKKNIPLGGGLAIFIAFFVMVGIAYWIGLVGDTLSLDILIPIGIAGAVLMVGGILDDIKNLKARYQILFPILAASIVAFAGIGPEEITNPFGGTFALALPLSGVLVFFWIFGMMFTTKFLDGLDGLVSGIVSIGAMMIFFLSRQEQWFQPEVATLALLFAGACLGFLAWNWHPAKIFLGEGGSLFTGFLLGVLGIVSGGKIMTTLLVVGIPFLDVIRVVMMRWIKKRPVYLGDDEHLHFKLLHSGMTQKQAVLLLYAISFTFGVTTLFLQSSQKIIAFAFLFVLMLLMAIWLQSDTKKKKIWSNQK
ncbi:MAG: hypothetical protein ACD_48C00273G0003 [uncultured bacterium]|nr:MAG: hypothetical protein ACD_48C00273G0003 [uncultured bacterium]